MSQSKHYPSSNFVALRPQYLEQVWSWRNLPHVRHNMHNDAPISWEEHQAWFNALQNNYDKHFFIFLQDKRPIGVLNFSLTEPATLEWGCYLGEDNVWPGSGLLLEIAALDFAFSQPGINTLYAEVLSFNKSVIKLHKLFRYQEMEMKPGKVRDGSDFCVRRFAYTKSDWCQNRDLVLRTLPKQICAAATKIHFENHD